jgi:hypothetical protein
MIDDEDEPQREEREAAARLARALDGTEPADTPEAEAATLVRAAAGRAAPLGELRARGLARAAVQAARPRRARRWPWALGAALAVLLLFVLVGRRGDPWPARLRARSAGLLVPGPFPPTQTAAERLDLVAAERLMAFREVRLARLARGTR